MTGHFLCVTTMRPIHCWTILHVLILAVLVFTLNADSEDSDCSPAVKVHRNTTYKTFLGEDLTINCTVALCNTSTPTVSWHKVEQGPVNVSSGSHIKIEWNQRSHSEGISYLTFHKILSRDSGSYQCQVPNEVSHIIYVSVNDGGEFTTISGRNNTKTHNPQPTEKIWMYVYSAAGTVAFVTIVIVTSTIIMHCCKEKSKKVTEMEHQYLAFAMVDPLHPRGGPQPSPRENRSDPPSQSSTWGKTPPLPPIESTSPGVNNCVSGQFKEDRQRIKTAEGRSVVYAALNHQLPTGAAPRPPRQREEPSEYAAIRVS